jgi:hypothetical protein
MGILRRRKPDRFRHTLAILRSSLGIGFRHPFLRASVVLPSPLDHAFVSFLQ